MGTSGRLLSHFRRDEAKVLAVLLLGVFGWAYAWVGIRAAVDHFDAGALALGRYAVASMVLLPIWFMRGANLPARCHWPAIGCIGLFGFTLYNLGINEAEKTVTAGTAALIASAIPVLNTLGARIWFGECVGTRRWAGILGALVGVSIIAISAEGRVEVSSGAVLVLLASISATVYGLVYKRVVRAYAALDVTTWGIWFGTVLLIPFGLGLPAQLATAPATATINLVALGIFPGAASYAAMGYAISRWPMARAISFLYLVSPLSVLLGWLFLDELPPSAALVGGCIALTSVVYVQRARGRVESRSDL